MHAVTIKEARARLNRLIDEAIAGEQVVLLRGSKHVAAIVPITDKDLELTPRLSEDQVDRLRHSLAEELARGTALVFDDAERAVAHLKKSSRRRAATPARRRRG